MFSSMLSSVYRICDFKESVNFKFYKTKGLECSTYNLIFSMVFCPDSLLSLMKSTAWVQQPELQDKVVLREGNSGASKHDEINHLESSTLKISA